VGIKKATKYEIQRMNMDYTEQDILEFIQSVEWSLALDHLPAGENKETCWIQMYGEKYRIYKKDLIHVIKKETYQSGLTDFLHMTPLEQVPLFIHDLPEFACWRLRIAK